MKLNGRQLMSSTSTSSEILLAKLACENLLRHPHPRILIGGLGLGFSLKAVLSLVGKKAEVHVAELLPEVIEWNRQFLMKLNGALLNDRRVQVFAEDVIRLIRRAQEARYDAILLDVDNGPTSFVQAGNSRLYSRRGFERIAAALQPGGASLSGRRPMKNRSAWPGPRGFPRARGGSQVARARETLRAPHLRGRDQAKGTRATAPSGSKTRLWTNAMCCSRGAQSPVQRPQTRCSGPAAHATIAATAASPRVRHCAFWRRSVPVSLTIADATLRRKLPDRLPTFNIAVSQRSNGHSYTVGPASQRSSASRYPSPLGQRSATPLDGQTGSLCYGLVASAL